MAKHKLNKKVALIGSLFVGLIIICAIFLILHFNREPDRYIIDGDIKLEAARNSTGESKKDLFEEAERNYLEASKLAKNDTTNIKILYRLAELYQDLEKWRKVISCWNGIIRLEPTEAKAQFSRLKYLYLTADSGYSNNWQNVISEASGFLKIAQDEALLGELTSKWDPFEQEQKKGPRLEPFLYQIRGRGNYEMVKAGLSNNQEQSLENAVADLQKVLELEPNNVEAGWYLALSNIQQGRIRAAAGTLAAREDAQKQALEILTEVKQTSKEASAYANLLSLKLMIAGQQRYEESLEEISRLKSEYASLLEEFPTSAHAYISASNFYKSQIDTLDDAIASAQKAIELDNDNVGYLYLAAGLYYNRFSIFHNESDFDKAISLAQRALTLPESQDTLGPRNLLYRRNRFRASSLLAQCYIEQILDSSIELSSEQKQQHLGQAEKMVHEIEQIIGTGKSVQVIKWRGLLELARGNRQDALRTMYEAYEQLKSSGSKDSLLSYWLAKSFEDSPQIGAIMDFYGTALSQPDRIDNRKPEVILDYADLLLKLRSYNGTLKAVEFFEKKFWPNERSKLIRMKAYIGAGQFSQVQDALAASSPNDTDALKIKMWLTEAKIRQHQLTLKQKQLEESSINLLQQEQAPEEATEEKAGPFEDVRLIKAQLTEQREQLGKTIKELLEKEPNAVDKNTLISMCNSYLYGGKQEQAEELVSKYLESFPDNVSVLFYKKLLSEPSPTEVSEPRRIEIEEQVLSSLSDSVRRSIELGRFYHRHNKLTEAVSEFQKVFKSSEPVEVLSEEAINASRVASNYLFRIAITEEDWDRAEKIVRAVRRRNLDKSNGQFFAARLAKAQGNNDEALQKLNEALTLRPVFSQGYLLRSDIHAGLGNYSLSVDDAKKAASLNPLDGAIARGLAAALYRRNRRLGEDVTPDQKLEGKRAILKAISLNPRDQQLKSFYADYISQEEPEQALAMRQQLQRAAPTAENTYLLGNTAMKLALEEKNSQKKEALLNIAIDSFKKALRMDPNNQAVLAATAYFYQTTGQNEKALALINRANNKTLLWRYYFQTEEYDQAIDVLKGLYEDHPNDANVIRGLITLSQVSRDKAKVKKYTDALISTEDNSEHRLLQIQTLLKVGLIKQAKYKLESYTERYSDDILGTMFQAYLASLEGRLEEALDLINRTLEANQSNATAWRIRGIVNLLQSKYSRAISDFKESKSLSDQLITRYYLGRAYLGDEQINNAITELRVAIGQQSFGEENAGVRSKCRRLLEQVYLGNDRKSELTEFYQETLKAQPESLFWHVRAGSFALENNEFETSEKLFAKALQIGNNIELSSQLANQFQKALDGHLESLLKGAGTQEEMSSWKPEKLDGVFKIGENLAESTFAPVAYLWMSEAKLKLGDRSAAVRYCQNALSKAISIANQNLTSEVTGRLNTILEPDEAMRICRQELEKNGDSPEANFAMFSLFNSRGSYNKAISYIDRSIQLAGAHNKNRLEYIQKKIQALTSAYNKTSDKKYLTKVITEYKSLLSEMPNNTIAFNNLAYVLADSDEELEQALQYAKQAYEESPSNAGFLDTYAYVLYKHGEYSKANRFIHASVMWYEQSGSSVPFEVYEHLGMITEKVGAKNEALNAYEQALEIARETLSTGKRQQLTEAIERVSEQNEEL